MSTYSHVTTSVIVHLAKPFDMVNRLYCPITTHIDDVHIRGLLHYISWRILNICIILRVIYLLCETLTSLFAAFSAGHWIS